MQPCTVKSRCKAHLSRPICMPSKASQPEDAFTVAFVNEARAVVLPRANIPSMTADVKECGLCGPGDVAGR